MESDPRWIELIDQARNLIVLKRKPGIGAERIAGLLYEFRHKPD